MATTKQLADLEPGDQIMTNEGRREWLQIINIDELSQDGEVRRALVEQCGGRRAGQRFPMGLYNYERGWTTR